MLSICTWALQIWFYWSVWFALSSFGAWILCQLGALTGHAQACQAAWGICSRVSSALGCSRNSRTGSTKALDTLRACWAGVSLEETQLGLWEKVKTLERKDLSKRKVFKEKSGNISTPTEWAPHEPKPQSWINICQTEQMYVDLMCSEKTSRNKLVSLGRLFFLVPICHSDETCTEPVNPALAFSRMTDVFLGARAGIRDAWRSSLLFPDRLLSMCPPCTSTLLELSWRRVCLPSLPMLLLHCGGDILLPHSLSIFPWVKISEGLCTHTKYWAVAYRSAEMGFRSRAWEEEALWLSMFNMSLRSGSFQLLERHMSREVKHGRLDTWEEVSRVPRTVVSDEPPRSRFCPASCVKWPLDLVFLLPALMSSADCSWKKNLESCVRLLSPRSSALMRYFLSFSVCSFPITLMI